MDYMNYFRLGAQGYECHEQLLVVCFGSICYNGSRLWWTWMTPGHELKALDAMKS